MVSTYLMYGLVIWSILGIAYLVGSVMYDSEVVEPAFFIGIVWCFIAMTIGITVSVERSNRFYSDYHQLVETIQLYA